MAATGLIDELPAQVPVAGASRVRYAVLAAACSAAVLTYVHRVAFATGAPEMKADLGLSTERIGILMSVFFWFYGGFQVVGGYFADRFGVRNLLALIVTGWSLATGALAFLAYVPDPSMQFAALLVLRALFGVFQAGVFPALARLTADWMPVGLRATAQGLIWMSTRIGGALIPLALVPMFTAFGTWRTPFLILGGLGVVWSALFWPWFRNRPEQMARVNKAELGLIHEGRSGPPPLGEHDTPVSWRRLLACRSAMLLCIAYGFGGFSANFFVGLLPLYLRDYRHLSPDTTKWLTSLPLACGVVACVAGGFLSDGLIRRFGNRRWGRRINGLVGPLIASMGILATTQVVSPLWLGVLLCITFAGNDLAMGPAWAACADVGERSAGTLGGAMNMMSNLGGAVAAIVIGRLFQAGHPEWAFYLFSASFAVCGLCWLGVDVTRPVICDVKPSELLDDDR